MQQPAVKDNTESYDVLVAGGGMAGIAAAIAAGRMGAKTILVEKAGWLGGVGIVGATGLHSFFNIFAAHQGAQRNRVVAGIAQEIVDQTTAMGGGIGHVLMEEGGDFVSMITPVEPEVFKLAAALICQEAGVEMLLHSQIDEVRSEAGRVEGVVVANKAGRTLLQARQFVDCTGDGDLAAWAGAPFETFKPDDPGAYHAGFTFRLCNVDLAAMEADLAKRGLITQLAHAVKPFTTTLDLVRLGIDMRGLRAAGAEGAPGYFLSSSLRPREITYCNCINYGPNDSLNPVDITNAELDLRAKMLAVADMFRKHVGGCEGCYPAGPAPAAGQRRGRAIHCDYEITRDDCISGRKFKDQIGCFSFIDNGEFFVEDAGAYGIPWRALLPRELSNVLIAGRMMTQELHAHNSTRNTVCCLMCGQAAGTGAAMAAKAGTMPRDLDAADIRAKLLEAGVLLDPMPDPIA